MAVLDSSKASAKLKNIFFIFIVILPSIRESTLPNQIRLTMKIGIMELIFRPCFTYGKLSARVAPISNFPSSSAAAGALTGKAISAG